MICALTCGANTRAAIAAALTRINFFIGFWMYWMVDCLG
jgi:hypothetical protein